MVARREELSEKERAVTMTASITNPETGENIEWSIPVISYNIINKNGVSYGIDTDHTYSFSATMDDDNNEGSD